MYMLMDSKLFMKWLERYDLSLFLMVVSDSDESIMGRAFKSLGKWLKKECLQLVEAINTCCKLVPPDLVLTSDVIRC